MVGTDPLLSPVQNIFIIKYYLFTHIISTPNIIFEKKKKKTIEIAHVNLPVQTIHTPV